MKETNLEARNMSDSTTPDGTETLTHCWCGARTSKRMVGSRMGYACTKDIRHNPAEPPFIHGARREALRMTLYDSLSDSYSLGDARNLVEQLTDPLSRLIEQWVTEASSPPSIPT